MPSEISYPFGQLPSDVSVHWTNRSRIKSSSDGEISLRNNADSAFSNITCGSITCGAVTSTVDVATPLATLFSFTNISAGNVGSLVLTNGGFPADKNFTLESVSRNANIRVVAGAITGTFTASQTLSTIAFTTTPQITFSVSANDGATPYMLFDGATLRLRLFTVAGAAAKLFMRQGTITSGEAGILTDVTWNNVNESFIGWQFNVTNTGSFSDSRFLEYQLGGVSTFAVRRDGNVLISNTQVVSTRRTGWATATGTATRTTFDTATVLLSQLAERVKALIDDLHSTAGHGLIGT